MKGSGELQTHPHPPGTADLGLCQTEINTNAGAKSPVLDDMSSTQDRECLLLHTGPGTSVLVRHDVGVNGVSVITEVNREIFLSDRTYY